tara:strand:- start:479 stop:835 length:357 start_codon:yes stop_codon:yes gene_type:complete
MKPISKIFGIYLLLILFILLANNSFSQVKVVQYNAEWNKVNDVEWCTSKQLTDCKVSYVDISENPEAQKEHSVVVVPTIIIFNGDEEVKRYQADLSFEMLAKLEDIQEYIDELLAEDY